MRAMGMYFDAVNDRGKVRAQAAIMRQRLVLERPLRRRLRVLLDHQYQVIAGHAEQGVFDGDKVIDSTRGLLIKAVSEHYTRVGLTFFAGVEKAVAGRPGFIRQTRRNATFKEKSADGGGRDKETPGGGPAETKGMAAEFWRAFHRWTLRQAAEKVKGIDEVTKRAIGVIISEGSNNGDSHGVIAESIWSSTSRDINLKRATRIARTETHVASTFAVDAAVRSTGMAFVREWVSMAGERTRPYPGTVPTRKNPWDHRSANGQRRTMGEPFLVSGEKLMHPGDPKGSAGNVIN